MDDDISAGQVSITTWDVFSKELREQFLPYNIAWLVMESLQKPKQLGSVWDYMKQFSSLMLDIKNMYEDSKLFNFMHGM